MRVCVRVCMYVRVCVCAFVWTVSGCMHTMDCSTFFFFFTMYTTYVVRLLDLPTGKSPRLIGNPGTTTNNENNSSKDACSCLQSLDGENPNIVASASWNKHFYLWDIRSTSTSPVCTLELPGKAFCMDVDRTHNRIVVATSGRKTCFIDIKAGKAESLALERDSSLKYPTRCVQFFPQGEGIAIGSVEGRVGVEFLDELGIPSTMKKYAFKCHRINDTVYPVNCIAFHPRFVSTFATGGCDGGVGKSF